MSQTDKRKQSLYFPEDMLKEIQDEATRQDRSMSWIVQMAWKLARSEIQRFPSVNAVIDADDQPSAPKQ
ncbi:MAG: TIGR04563 family protein [Deltaproteobacteria bacterium]|nr:TIGR04563 family protein [Deltaproteobacteria bacterium]